MEIQLLSSLAAAAVSLLVSFLTKAGEAASRKAGEDIYQRLKARFQQRPAAQEVLAELERQPNDADVQAAARLQLRKLLEEDQAFATVLHELVETSIDLRAKSITIDQKSGNASSQFGQVFGNVTLSKPAEKDSYEDVRVFHEGGRLAQALMIFGIALIIGGLLLFLSGIVGTFISFPRQLPAGPPTGVVIGFPTFILGIIISGIGTAIARNTIYKKRKDRSR